MNIGRATAAVVGAFLLGGCVSQSLTGRQVIAVTVAPDRAVCDVARTDGWRYGRYQGPAFDLDVRKNGKPLEITCQARGYNPATVTLEPSVNRLVAAGSVLSVTTFAFGSTNGNLWLYPETASIALTRSR
ncbi:hypothetical protein [Mongoliimonas terrestris]|uniref:hypothetical protein n=1 Tax=Mongoliimonas terrestris TaxID=1709001 RepID=UPI000ABBDF2D|nr:hypothetical protein [Mongoliimonas terrestris]